MTINYKGMTKDYEYRMAEINFKDSEWNLIIRMADVLRKIKGWEDLEVVTDGYAGCRVADFDEYKAFVKDYKEIKKTLTLCEKFGF